LGSGRRKSWAARKKSGREGPQLKRREGEKGERFSGFKLFMNFKTTLHQT
jgi:hypothetical protein